MAKTQKVEIQGRASTGIGCRHLHEKSVSELCLGTRFGAELCPDHELLIPPTALCFPAASAEGAPAPCLHMCLARARPGPISRPGAAPKTNMDADRSFASAPQLYLTFSRKSLWFNTFYFPLPVRTQVPGAAGSNDHSRCLLDQCAHPIFAFGACKRCALTEDLVRACLRIRF